MNLDLNSPFGDFRGKSRTDKKKELYYKIKNYKKYINIEIKK